jgi:3D (Asp-Asp-Asp) domain-containing protein
MMELVLAAVLSAAPVFTITAYTASCHGCSGITASGVVPGPGTASCPRRFAFHTKLYVDGYGMVTCLDRGRDIRNNRLDIFMPSRRDALRWGRQRRVVLAGEAQP